MKLSTVVSLVVMGVAAVGCAEKPQPDEEQVAFAACESVEGPAVEAPASPECANDKLTGFDGLLVITPHPDDEVLGFGGLIGAYLAQQKPVEVLVTTDGDAYCGACRLWKNNSAKGPLCDAADLSNFDTEAIDSFAELRRSESTAAMAVLGAGEPTFLGYPDTGVGAAWANYEAGDAAAKLRRADFSGCDDCETCRSGILAGPETGLSAESLIATLTERISATSENTLLATTHSLDAHGDHAGLGEFVRTANAGMESPRPMVFGVIHANTPGDSGHPDCWYPAPTAPLCPCIEEDCALADPDRIATLRQYRFRPDWPASLPDDADYGEEIQLCLPEAMYRGEDAVKLRAVESFASQLGFAARQGELPPPLRGLTDCSGYLLAFVRSTEAFVLVEP